MVLPKTCSISIGRYVFPKTFYPIEEISAEIALPLLIGAPRTCETFIGTLIPGKVNPPTYYKLA